MMNIMCCRFYVKILFYRGLFANKTYYHLVSFKSFIFVLLFLPRRPKAHSFRKHIPVTTVPRGVYKFSNPFECFLEGTACKQCWFACLTFDPGSNTKLQLNRYKKGLLSKPWCWIFAVECISLYLLMWAFFSLECDVPSKILLMCVKRLWKVPDAKKLLIRRT